MGIITVTAAAAIALGSGVPAAVDEVSAQAQCVFEPVPVLLDASAGPLLVSTVVARRPAPAGVMQQGQWGQAALRPYDVMTSLGTGGTPALPTPLSLADAPAPVPVTNPFAWVLAGAGLLGMLYVRRTQF